MLHKDYDRKCSAEKTDGSESESAWHQDELIGGKKNNHKVTLTLTL
jgi:hypothetical protein